MDTEIDEYAPDEQALYEDLLAESESEAVRTLAVEAIRVWRRLCELDRVLSGDRETWLNLADGHGGDITVRIDGALAEARQQGAAYRGLVADIRKLAPVNGTGGGANDDLAGMPT